MRAHLNLYTKKTMKPPENSVNAATSPKSNADGSHINFLIFIFLFMTIRLTRRDNQPMPKTKPVLIQSAVGPVVGWVCFHLR
jgi:hypothetical protein